MVLILEKFIDAKELVDYLVSSLKYRDLVLHSVDMNKMENF